MIAVGALLPILMFLLACFVMPETPRWLISKGKKAQALEVLRRLTRTEQEAVETAERISQAVAEERAESGHLGSPLRQLCRPTPRLRLMLIVVVGVAVMQQVRKVVLTGKCMRV
jgi:SP family arabinose:H+ symporter-like MFS transporter